MPDEVVWKPDFANGVRVDLHEIVPQVRASRNIIASANGNEAIEGRSGERWFGRIVISRVDAEGCEREDSQRPCDIWIVEKDGKLKILVGDSVRQCMAFEME